MQVNFSGLREELAATAEPPAGCVGCIYRNSIGSYFMVVAHEGRGECRTGYLHYLRLDPRTGGIIGSGRIGDWYLQKWRRVGRCEIIISDPEWDL